MNIPIDSMTTAEKIEAMEMLRASLQKNPEHHPPLWHKRVLDMRRAKIERGETKFSTLQEVIDRIDEKNQDMRCIAKLRIYPRGSQPRY